MAKSSLVLSAILLLAFVLAIPGMARPIGDICDNAIRNDIGSCTDKQCDEKCKGPKKADKGICHNKERMMGCYCHYYTCHPLPPGIGKLKPGAIGNSGGGSGAGNAGGKLRVTKHIIETDN